MLLHGAMAVRRILAIVKCYASLTTEQKATNKRQTGVRKWRKSLFIKGFRRSEYTLYRIINEAAALQQSTAGANITVTDLPSETLKMATAVLSITMVLKEKIIS